MRGARRLAVGLAAVSLVAASGAVGSSGETERAVRPGGVNAMPSMRPWLYRGANPDGWWCTADGCSDVTDGTVFIDREVPLAAALGASTLRVEFPWALIEPRRGRFDWRRADYIVHAARRARIQLQPVLVYSPSWAAPSENSAPRAADFARFVRTVARRYRGRIRYYELWNEPDLARYWNASVQSYVSTILRPGYRGVKAADRRAKVIIGGPSTASREWFEAVFRFGGGRSFDIAAYHGYAPPAFVLKNAAIVRSVLDAHGQRRKPIWLGEYGLEESDQAAPQQELLVREALTGTGPVAAAQWYSLRDTLTVMCCPPRSIEFEPFGLVTKTYVPKRSFFVMQELLTQR